MKRKLIIDSLFSYERAGLLENDELREIIIEEKTGFNIGDIFVAKIKKILPDKFAFLDLGQEKNAFLPLNDKKQKNLYTINKKNKKVLSIKEGQDILVQIDKQGTEIKGSSVTTNITLTGRYVVLMLKDNAISISKKITSKEKRQSLKNFASENLQNDFGLIFRTSCNEVSFEIIKNEINLLIEKANALLKTSEYIKPPFKVFSDKSEVEKLINNILNANDEVIVNCKNSFNSIKNNFENVSLYEDNLPIFEAYGIENKLEKLFNNKVWLKSGGFLMINYSEAMTVIDVNTGKNISKNFDDMIFKTNKEAVEEITKEIRLRNISGMILIDFIDMKNKEHTKYIEEYMKTLSINDRMPIVIYPINELFIMHITRKKALKPIYEIVSKPCITCSGSGKVKNEVYIANIIQNKILSIFSNTIYNKLVVYANIYVINLLLDIDFKDKKVEFVTINNLRFDFFKIEKFIC